MKAKTMKAIAAMAAAIAVAGCDPTPEASIEFSGTATKGPVAGGTATAYALNADGSRGIALATANTGTDGSFTMNVGTHAGAVELAISGGTYVDEATGTSVQIQTGEEMRMFMSQARNGATVAVTALTTIAAENAKAAAAGAGLATAIENANARVATAFGLDGVDIDADIPADLTSASSGTATQARKRYGAVQAGLTQYAASNGLAAGETLRLMTCLAEDFSDGDFDGLKGDGTAVQTMLRTGAAIAPKTVVNGLQAAVQAFMAGANNKSGATSQGLGVAIPTVN